MHTENGVGKEGIVALEEGLKSNTTLMDLDVSVPLINNNKFCYLFLYTK